MIGVAVVIADAIGPATRQTSSARGDVEDDRDHEQDEPRAMRLDVWRPTDASLNVVAIFEAIVCDWSKRRIGRSGLLPMTIVTAIVSPSARPRPRMIAPMMPGPGERQDRPPVVSQRVAPRAEHRLALAVGDGP